MKKTLLLTMALAFAVSAKKFYSDDPLLIEPKVLNVKEAANRKLSDYFDLFSNQFAKFGERQPKQGPPIRAKAVNTPGEPMDSSWWERRHYYKRMNAEELKRGPGNTNQPTPDSKWTITAVKAEGVTPGFTIRDGKKGIPRKLTQEDLLPLFAKVPKAKDGKYRATASLALPGKPIGPPRYYGTRSDDPNDIVLHEHRRDVRALHVINAWLDHDDSRAINNLDILYKDGDTQYIKHYMLDFASTLGSGTQQANSARSGSYFFSWKEAAKQLFTLGLMPPYWAFARYPDFPSVGRFEYKIFDPEKWVPEYPNSAFLNRLPDDEFWGAKLVTAFSDDELRTLVSVGELSDPKAADWMLKCLIERRGKIGKAYFAKVLPLDQFQFVGGELRWVDLGAKLGYQAESTVSQ